MAAVTKFPEPLVFGLDIGTRSIVGTVGYRENNQFHIVAQCVKYHDTRAMLDGQIHDINKVGEEIVFVKRNLEQQLQGRKLKEVCIAAAGRVLKTATAKADYEFSENTVVTQEYIHSLEMLGVEKAHETMLKDNDTDVKFFCVGYTVIKYFLNDYEITNLEGHKAHNIGAEVLATFLPEEVVDGLYAAVSSAGLEIANMTLEPIAAIQVAIPENYRLLNIALVDVGAGTSDICITKDGTIIGYGMLPKAGDEITESIIRSCLVDFDTAEKIKTVKPKRKSIAYKDIMGISHSITPQDVYEQVKDTIDDITGKIAERIIDMNNGKAVSAVFVVGGGGKIPGFTNKLAEHLGIPEERVALRGEEVLGFVNIHVEGIKKDPLLVTPIGICLNFYDQKNRFIYLQVNNERIKLYDTDKLTVFDAALAYGLSNDSIFPKRGADLNYVLNGKKKFVRGKSGEAAVIQLNDNEVGMNHLVQAGDQIKIVESTSGEDAKATLNEVADFNETLSFVVNDMNVNCPKLASVNGKIESEFYQLNDGDKIEILNYYTLSQLMQFMDIETPHEVFVNGARANADTHVYENFNVAWIDKEEVYKNERFVQEDIVEDVEDEDQKSSSLQSVSVKKQSQVTNSLENNNDLAGRLQSQIKQLNETPTQISAVPTSVFTESEGKDEYIEVTKNDLVNKWIANTEKNNPNVDIHVTVNGKGILLTGKPGYVFVDVFDKYEFDLKNVKGTRLVQTIDGVEAQHFSPLHNGAVVELYWKE